jgi:hypothetical protein
MDPRNGTREQWIGYILLMLGCIALVLATAESAPAATATNDPDAYKISFELRFRKEGEAAFSSSANVTGTNLDIAAGGPGSTTATLAASVDTGFKYDKAQATLTCTVKLKGSVTCQAGTCGSTITYYTTSGGGVSTTAPAVEGTYNFPGPCAGASSVSFESPVFSPALEIGGTLKFTFNAAGALELNFTGIPPAGPQLSPGAFSATMTTQ